MQVILQTLNAMLISFFQFICNQLKKVPPFVSADLSGKTVLVVGANVGIGYETAKYFATLNPGKLILACRSFSRGEAALASPFNFVLCFDSRFLTVYDLELKQETGCHTAELRLVDLTNFDSVNDFCTKFDEEIDRLDLIIENAGILPLPDRPTTGNGWEST
jgi:NAD(P)-dependent dehydrogenase (short-subunit alcohol dehydrogenase family)